MAGLTTTSSTLVPSAPSLQESMVRSTEAWQADLEGLFRSTKERFPDVVWEVGNINEGDEIEEVWGHKAIVYARAPPSFQSRYFQFRPSVVSPSQSPIPNGTTSALSLSLGLDIPSLSAFNTNTNGSRTPSPFRSGAVSPVPSTNVGGILRLRTAITPSLFSNELEYLYTGQGFGEAFEFLFDSSDTPHQLDEDGFDAQELRLDKLRKDLVFMWRSRLYSDVRISLTGNFSSSGDKEHENATAVFSTHRFILVSRSTYFRDILLPSPLKSKNLSSSLVTSNDGGAPTITLPCPPFTPASLHFTLGYLYTGTLAFSHRTYDLTTAFHIMLSSLPQHLNLPHLKEEIRARIVMELCHGLFHAFLEFGEYEALTKGRWGLGGTAAKNSRGGAGGCRCRQCARRAPRVLEFAVRDDVKDPYLDRGARRALVGLFGEGWVTQEWSSLSQKLRDSIVKGLKKRTTPENVWAMLFAVEGALAGRLSKNREKIADRSPYLRDKEPSSDSWTEVVRADLLRGRDGIDEVLAERVTECFSPPPGLYPPPAASPEDLANGNADLRNKEKGNEAELQTEWHDILLRAASSTHSSMQPSSQAHSHYLSLSSTIRSEEPVPLSATSTFEDSQNLTLILTALMRGLRPANAPLVYQTLLSNILLLPAPSPDPNTSMSIYGDEYPSSAMLIPATSHVRVQVEEKRMEVLNWIRSRWRSVRDAGGFADERMEGWAIKEIGDYMEVPAEELLSPPSASHGSPHTSPASRLKVRNETDSASIHSAHSLSPSIRVSLLSRNLPQKSSGGPSTLKSSASSIRSVRTVGSARSGISVGTTSTARRRADKAPLFGERPDSKLTPAASVSDNIGGLGLPPVENDHELTEDSELNEDGDGDVDMLSSPLLDSASTSAATSPSPTPSQSASSIAPSPVPKEKPPFTTSMKSTPSPTTRRVTPGSSRIVSRGSTASTTSTTSSISPRTARTSPAPPRPRSVASTRSTRSTVSTSSTVRRNAAGLKAPPIPRPISSSTSGTSVSSSTTNASGTTGTSDFHTAPSTSTPRQRTVSATSTGSVRSTRSTATTATTRSTTAVAGASTGKRVVSGTAVKRPPSIASSVRSVSSVKKPISSGPASRKASTSSITGSTKSKATDAKTPPVPAIPKEPTADVDHKKTESTASTASSASTKTLRKKGSSDTITKRNAKSGISATNSASSSKPSSKTSSTTEDAGPTYPSHLGATLEIGIPCIISSKRKRFKALARYIGEVEGELGPWVGVEVPIGEGSGLDRSGDVVMGNTSSTGGPSLEDRQWNDGSWGGIRYFEIGGSSGGNGGSEWGDSAATYGDDSRASRRRKLAAHHASGYGKGTKRRGDQWSGDSGHSGYGKGAKKMRMVRSASPSASDSGTGGMTESRGLFVRPQQVLYVVDAIDEDL